MNLIIRQIQHNPENISVTSYISRAMYRDIRYLCKYGIQRVKYLSKSNKTRDDSDKIFLWCKNKSAFYQNFVSTESIYPQL